MELLACKVPATQDLDRLLRYEASLERTFDRTLAQLERLQRLRLGLAVPHRVELQATVSQGWADPGFAIPENLIVVDKGISAVLAFRVS